MNFRTKTLMKFFLDGSTTRQVCHRGMVNDTGGLPVFPKSCFLLVFSSFDEFFGWVDYQASASQGDGQVPTFA